VYKVHYFSANKQFQVANFPENGWNFIRIYEHRKQMCRKSLWLVYIYDKDDAVLITLFKTCVSSSLSWLSMIGCIGNFHAAVCFNVLFYKLVHKYELHFKFRSANKTSTRKRWVTVRCKEKNKSSCVFSKVGWNIMKREIHRALGDVLSVSVS